MKASDIMTANVVTCSPDTEVVALAQMMAAHGISGVPVLSEEKLVGIVSEGDLIRRAELGDTRDSPGWWLRLTGKKEKASDYVKTQGRHARDVMSKDVATVGGEDSLSEVAELFEKKHIKRAPVLDAKGRLVGIVSRANFVSAIARSAEAPADESPKDDASISTALVQELESHLWWRTGTNSLTVLNGVVHFWGYYNTADELNASRVAAENTPGVVRVEEHRTRYPMAYT